MSKNVPAVEGGVPVLKESQVIPVPLADEDPNAITIREKFTK